jgi:dihydroflavonol-4-reductase
MRVGLTGATGFLGSHVARLLVDEGHDVVALRRPTSSAAAVDGLELDWVVGEVSDHAAVGELVAGCEAVIHSAAVIANWRGAGRDHELVNVGATRTVADACLRAGVGRLVHVSSVAAVAAAGAGTPADEKADFDVAGKGLSYHDSKHRAEAVVSDAVREGLDAVIVNPASLQGPHVDGFRGAQLIEGVRGRQIVPYFRGGTNIAHVDDVAAGVLGAIEHGRTGERYILAGENHTWRELAEIVAGILGLRRVLVRVPGGATAAAALIGETVAARTRRPGFTRDVHFASSHFLYYDSGKAVHELGYAYRPYREIVHEYLATHPSPSR